MKKTKIDKPVVSSRFDLDDIRKMRDFNSSRHTKMTREEIIADTRNGAVELLDMLIKRNSRKAITVISGNRKTVYEPPCS